MQTLFHYCSTSTFASIISNKSIWLSSLSLSNDTMEGRLVTQTFERLFSQSAVGDDEREEIRKALQITEDLFDGLGFCLSEHPDLLSQWRGYADDGQGLSIGFNRSYLQQLRRAREKDEQNFMIGKILYEPSEQEAALKPTYDKIMQLVNSGNLKKRGLLSQTKEEDRLKTLKALREHAVIDTFQDVHRLKTQAFKEEAEWRLVSYLFKDKDSGDTADFRAAGNRLIPYREFKLKQLPEKSISEVYIGPKNITPNYVIEKFLELNGFKDVSVKRSAASYR